MSRISPSGFRNVIKKTSDIDPALHLGDLHEVVERQVAKGATAKHRLKLKDGSTGFIRGTAKGVRSRLYRE